MLLLLHNITRMRHACACFAWFAPGLHELHELQSAGLIVCEASGLIEHVSSDVRSGGEDGRVVSAVHPPS